jgi:hypothetical protein
METATLTQEKPEVQELLGYTFEYTILSEGRVDQFSIKAFSEEEAREVAPTRIADMEMLEPEDIKVNKLVKTFVPFKQAECEGCSS